MPDIKTFNPQIKLFDEPHTPETLRWGLGHKKIYSGKFINPQYSGSYLTQMCYLMKLKVKSVLEVGPGEGVVRDYMKKLGMHYDTMDISSESAPTITSSLEDLDTRPYRKAYECVCAFQVLEHSPYKCFSNNLKKMKLMSTKYVLISLPYSCWGFRFSFSFCLGQNRQFNIPVSYYTGLNHPNRRYRPDYLKEFPWAVHYWEIGRRDYPLKRVLTDIESTGLTIIDKFHAQNPFHYFIISELK